MGLMDKVKAQAEQAVAKGQQAMAQGQAKVEELQAKRQGDALLRDLGAAYYAQQRSGGSAAAVAEALGKVEAHVAEHGDIDASPTAPDGTQDQAASGSNPTCQSFNLDDV
jgi:hypothetical protein